MRHVFPLLVATGLGGCDCAPHHPCEGVVPARADVIPADIVKGAPDNDPFPPRMLSSDFAAPEPLPAPVTTAGAEDSPFFAPDGTLFFFFAPDARVPASQQLTDCSVGIWQADRTSDGGFEEPRRLLLSDDVALDGCPTVVGETLTFCSVRADNTNEIDVFEVPLPVAGVETVRRVDELNARDIGEWHFSPDGATVWFGAELADSRGARDLYEMHREGEAWGTPLHLGDLVNSAEDEAFPWVSPDGREMYFGRNSAQGGTGPAIWRSVRGDDGVFGVAEEIVNDFAGEPHVDADGNLIFVHHYMTPPEDGPLQIREADLWIARRQ